MRRIALVFVGLTAGVWVAGSAAVSASAGIRVDRGFGSGRGFVTTRIPGTEAVAYGAIVLPGGRIVVAGQASPPSGNGQVVVVRYLPNGRLDRSFGSGGRIRVGVSGRGRSVPGHCDRSGPRTGKLVVAGGYGQGSMLVMRLTPDGRLDPTFGPRRSGFATVDVGGIATALAIQPDGGILLGGSNANRPGRPFVVVRFTRNGTLDRGFGHRGVAQQLFWNPSAGSGAGLSLATTRRRWSDRLRAHRLHRGHGRCQRRARHRWGLPPDPEGTSVAGIRNPRPPAGHVLHPRARSGVVVSVCDGRRRARPDTRDRWRRNASQRALHRSTDPTGCHWTASYGSAKNGRAITPGVGGNAITTCGASSTRAGVLTVGVQSRLAQLLPNGLPNRRFARGGVAQHRQARAGVHQCPHRRPDRDAL